MRGTMLWFNETKDLGAIRSEDGERLAVHGSCFAEGKRPQGRCLGAAVIFELRGSPGARSAEDVRLVPLAEPRRARLHHSSYRMRS